MEVRKLANNYDYTTLLQWPCKSIIYSYVYVYIYLSIYVYLFLSLFIDCYFCYVHLLHENGSFFWYYFFTDGFGITWTITYSKMLHSLKTSVELFCIFCWFTESCQTISKRLIKMFFALL